jgi:hypothetical protein
VQFAIPTHHTPASISRFACFAVAFVGAQTCKGTMLTLVAAASIRVQAMPVRSLLTVPEPDPPKFTQLLSWSGVSTCIPPIKRHPQPNRHHRSSIAHQFFFAFRPKLVQSQSLPTPAGIVALACPSCTWRAACPCQNLVAKKESPCLAHYAN